MQHALAPAAQRTNAPRLLRRLAAAAVALLLALIAQQSVAGSGGRDAAFLFLAALALYLAAFPRATEPLPVGAAPRVRNRALHLAGIVALGAAAGLTIAAALDFTTANPAPGGWSLHLAAIGAVVLGGLLLAVAQERGAHPARRWWPLLSLVAITAAAAALRLTRLDTLPFGIWYDEAENALAAQSILHNADYRPFYLGSTFHTAHHNYLVAAAFAWLGETIGSARLVSALMGILMVPAAYLAAAELFWTTPSHARERSAVPPTMGLLSAAIVAFSSWALNFSRIAVNYIATPLFVLIAVGFLLRGLRTQRYAACLVSGLALGMGLNFYSSFRLFVPVLPLFLLAALIARRDLWARSWRGLLVWALAALVAAAPLLTFAATNREDFLARSRETFLLKDRPADERLDALLANTRTHLLMFNVRGDPNGRHNLPGRPMLDPVLGALFVVGAGVCLWRWRRPACLLLPLWLGLTLLGGILTLDFEAPQSLRANGAMPAAYLIALVPLAEMLRAWERSDGGRYAPRLGPALAAFYLVPVVGWHLHQYYVVQQRNFAVWNAFSAPETITARTLAALDPDQSAAYVISYYFGHPTLHFLAPHWRERYRQIESTDTIPLAWPAGKDAWLFLDVDSEVLFRTLQAVYPTAAITEHTPPFADTVTMRQVHLSRAVIESVQGLAVRYYANHAWRGQPVATARAPTIDADWEERPPIPLPFSVEYEGILRADSYGPHTFRLLAPGRAELLIDETRILAGVGELTGAVTLARGNHTLRLRAVGGPGLLQLAWRTPDRAPEVLPSSSLFTDPVTANGLLGRFYPNDNWQPPAALETIDPQINIIYHTTPLNRPFTVEWSGKIAIPETGAYLFSVEAIDKARLEIDGQVVALALAAQMTSDGAATLEEGLHDIRVLYTALSPYSRINLYWTPPGGARSPVPGIVLIPPRGDYSRVEVPSFAMLAPLPARSDGDAAAATAAGDAGLGPMLGADTQIMLTGLARPAGLAAAGDRLYVADTGNAQVLIVGRSGRVARTLTGGADPFEEPFDLAVGPDGTLYVLDAAAATIVLFDADGAYLRTLRPDPTLIGRSRGLDVDSDGRIWIANTPGQRIVVLAADGTLDREFPVWPGEEAQVVDVLAAGDGAVYATVLGVNKLLLLDAQGRRTLAWDLPPANSMDAPHLAAGAGGLLLVTQPEESRVALVAPDGTRQGYYQLPQGTNMVKPVGIAAGDDGAILVTDTQGGRLVRLLPAKQAP